MAQGSSRWLVLTICCTSLLMVGLDTTALNVALPEIQREMHASIAGSQWIIDAYTLVLACLLLFSGSLGDRIGRKTIFLTGLALFAGGSLACSLAPSIGWLIGFRMLQAVGGSMMNPVAMAIITNVFPDSRERAKAIGVWSGTIGVSTAAGPVVGGYLVDQIGWEAIFWINVPIAIAAFVATVLFVPNSKSATPRRFDPVGQLLAAGFLGLLVFGIIEGPHRGWGSVEVLGCFTGSVLCLVGLVKYEARQAEPLIPLDAFRSAPFRGACEIAVCVFAALGGFLFLNTFYLQDVRGSTPMEAGLQLLPMALAMLIFGPVSGRMVARHGARPALIIGGVIATVAMLLLVANFHHHTAILLITAYALFGAGDGMMNTPITHTAVSGLPASRAGVASALTGTSRQVGQCLGVAIIGSIIASHPDAFTSAEAFETPATIGGLTLTAFCAVALVVGIITTRRSVVTPKVDAGMTGAG